MFDDFHLIRDESILRFVQNLILAKLENFCVIINSRIDLSFDLSNMLTSSLVGRIMAGDRFDSISEHIDNNMFINYNPYTECYILHHLYLMFLTGKQKYLVQQDIDNTYLQAADWCVVNDHKLEALDYRSRNRKCSCSF